MKHKKYYADLRFADGGASLKSNNLRKLKARIKRGFSGEQTDWGWTATGPLESWAIFSNGRVVEESEGFRG